MVPLFGLAPGGVCRAGWLPNSRCALAAPFHPCHACLATSFGGLLSVALSVGSRRPGVTWHLALWSPDFPRCLRVATVRPTPPVIIRDSGLGTRELNLRHSGAVRSSTANGTRNPLLRPGEQIPGSVRTSSEQPRNDGMGVRLPPPSPA